MNPSPKDAPTSPRADQPERGGAALRGAHVGSIGVGDGEARAGGASQHAREKHPGERRRQREEQEMRAQPQQRPEQQRPAPEPVGQSPEKRRAEELHHAVDHHQRTVPVRLQLAARREFAHQQRQHGQRDADAEHVDEHHDEDERHRRGAAASRRPRLSHAASARSPIATGHSTR